MLSQYQNLLSQFLSFKSISADSKFKLELLRTAEWLKVLFEENGFTVELWESDRANPVVFASYCHSGEEQSDDSRISNVHKSDFGRASLARMTDKIETILVYGHYDVQPAEENDGWKNDPFILREEKGRFVGRGGDG